MFLFYLVIGALQMFFDDDDDDDMTHGKQHIRISRFQFTQITVAIVVKR